MSKTFTLVYAGASNGALNAKSKAQITIATGNRKTIAIPCFSEGRVHRVYVKQLTGTSKAFDVELLTSLKPYAVGEPAYNAALTVAAASPALFRAIPKQTQTVAGQAHDYWSDTGHPFINADQVTHTANERFLYLTIIPVNTTDQSTWEVTIVTSTDMGAT